MGDQEQWLSIAWRAGELVRGVWCGIALRPALLPMKDTACPYDFERLKPEGRGMQEGAHWASGWTAIPITQKRKQ